MNIDIKTSVPTEELQLCYYGQRACSPRHRYGPAMRDLYVLHYILKGKGTYRTKNITYDLDAQHMFLMFPGQMVLYQADANDPWEYMWIGFNGRIAQSCLESLHLKRTAPTLYVHDTSCIEAHFKQLFHYKQKQPLSDSLFYLGWLHYFFAYLLNTQPSSLTPGGYTSTDNLYVQKAIHYMYQHFDQKLTMKDVANHVSLERSYFSKMFKQQTGISPSLFLTEYRIEKSLVLLKQTDLSIENIAHSAGFESIEYFSTTFKKYMHMSPTLYRKL